MKVWNTCLLFTNVEQLIAGMELQLATRTIPCVYHVLDDCYPVNREQNLRLMTQLKKRHEDRIVIYHSPKNLGFHVAFNHLMSLLPLEDDDIILTVAPDTVPLRKGWDAALLKVLECVPDIAYVGTSSYAIRGTAGVNWETAIAGDVRYGVPTNRTCMLHAAAFRWSFIKQIGGFHEPCAYYGHIETHLWSKLQQHGLRHAYLLDYDEDFRLEAFHDDVYRRWKMAHAHTFTFKGNLEEYLAAGNK